jgi:hypothetical protein
MRSPLTPILVVALLAAGAAPAAARPEPPNRVDAANHAATMRSLARQRPRDGQLVSASPAGAPAPAPTVRVMHLRGGFDWVDAGIGAGLTGALLLGAAGVASVRRHPTMTVQP